MLMTARLLPQSSGGVHRGRKPIRSTDHHGSQRFLVAQNLFHKTHVRKFALDIRWGEPELKRALAGPLLERFIGVIYVRPALRWTPILIGSMAWKASYKRSVVQIPPSITVRAYETNSCAFGCAGSRDRAFLALRPSLAGSPVRRGHLL